jgi:hypothetical protein
MNRRGYPPPAETGYRQGLPLRARLSRRFEYVAAGSHFGKVVITVNDGS